MDHEQNRQLPDALLEPARYSHPVTGVDCIETHANWILLAGDYAYKIKKPVDFGFLDFSTLARRRFYCEEEVRLNRRLAPEIYHRVVPITGSPDAPELDGGGEPFEYAVRMARFDPEQCLDRLLDRDEPARDDWDAFASDVAAFHRDAEKAPPGSRFGDPGQLWRLVADNFRDAAAHLDGADGERLAELERHTRGMFDELHATIATRQKNGHVRECHGDLHSANLVRYQGRIRAFDCVEFNPDLRWIDTANDIAFLLMDLHYRRRPDLAARWRSRYLEWLGDYGAVPLLRFYESYRAMVRCKIALLTAAQQGSDDPRRREEREKAGRYLATAATLMNRPRPRIIITCGLSGSGKSTVGMGIVEQLLALRLRSDIERKRLFGLDPLARTQADIGEGIYSSDATERTYARLAELAGDLVQAGESVLVDASFLDRRMRTMLHRTARRHDVPFTILHTTAPGRILKERAARRRSHGRDVSEAGPDVISAQMETADPPGGNELEFTVEVDTSEPVDHAALAERIRASEATLSG